MGDSTCGCTHKDLPSAQNDSLITNDESPGAHSESFGLLAAQIDSLIAHNEGIFNNSPEAQEKPPPFKNQSIVAYNQYSTTHNLMLH